MMFSARRARLVKLLGLLTMGTMMMGATGCVSVDEHKKLQTAFDESRRQLAEAENDKQDLQKRVTELQAQVDQLNELMNQTGGGVDALRKERDLLAAKLAELQDKYNKLAELASNPVLPGPVNDALRRLAEQYPDLLEFDESRGLVRFKSDLTFDLGSTEVKPRAREALAKFAQILNFPDIAKNEVRIVGNTDDVPIRSSARNVMNPTNWNLSTNRAVSVLFVLRNDGVNEQRFQAAGWGENRPIEPNAAGRHGNERNRRVDVYILPTSTPDNLPASAGEIGPTGEETKAVRTKHKKHPHNTATQPAPMVDTIPAPHD